MGTGDGTAAIVVEDLRMDYGPLRAVDGLSFRVRRGEIYALLGPNGAGKTSTVEILEGHRRRTGGTVRVLGCDPWRAGRRFRERVGIVLQSGGVDAELTVTELVRLYASFHTRPRDVAATIDQVGLTGKRRARARTLSGGQLRRLDLALALVGDPELIFLDEPTTGFDPGARRSAWEMIGSLRALGKTILLTSHYLDEVQQLADRVAVIGHGRLIAESTPAELGGRADAETVITFRIPSSRPDGLPAGPWRPPELHGDEITLRTDQPTRSLLTLTSWAVGHGEELQALTVARPSLEDVYLEITESARPPEAPMAADAPRPRVAVLLALGQVRYQLLLLVRNPLGFFLALVVPLLLMVSLNLLTPGGPGHKQLLTVGIATFCLLNACYVNTITGLVLAREEGILKRLRGTPLPTWAYLAGRFGSALLTAAVSVGTVLAVGLAFFDLRLVRPGAGYLLATGLLAVVCYFLLGVAVSTLVPKPDTALPVAFGTMLPLAFISDVFFSSPDGPGWLHDAGSAFPIAPVARAMGAAFDPATTAWPMPATGLLCLAGWTLGAVALIAVLFRWEPGAARLPGLSRRAHH